MLVSVRGDCSYQRRLVLGIGVIYSAASTFIVGLGFFLAPPLFVCRDGQRCTEEEACRHGHYTLDDSSIHSMVYEWKLVCGDQYQASLIGSLYFLGLTVGSVFIGVITDALGRQKTCLYFLGVLGVTLMLGSFAPGPIYIDVVSVVAGAVEAVLSVAAYLLLNESLSSDLRSWLSGVAFAFWSGGTMVVALLFLGLNDWRQVMFVCSTIPFLAVPFTLCLPESIRWLVANKRRYDSALQVLHRMAKANKVDPATVELHPLAERQEDADGSHCSTLLSGFRGLFGSRKMQARLFGINFIWITVNVVYYGTLMCVTSFHGNVYVNGVLLGFGETVPNLVMGKIADSVKRKTVIIASCLIGCAGAMAVWVLGELDCALCSWPSMCILLLTMMAIDSFYLLIYIYTAELFPTKVRGAGYALCNTTCRLGGLLASNLLLIQQETGVHPLLIIAGCLFVSVFPVLWMPETLGQPLMDYH